jgi:ubiquinone biosynthesis protein Coq4
MLLNLREHIQSLRMLAGLAKFLKHPDSLESVFAIAGSVLNSPLAAQMGRYLLGNPGIQAMLADNWRPNPIDLNALEQLPEDSLGYIYAKQLKAQGLTPEALIDPSPITNQREFLIHRLRETHDIVHVLTGFGIDGPGELGLQAFNLAQNRSPLAVMLIFGGMLSSLQNDKPIEPLLRALSRGFELGLAANCVISYRLEDNWERPLSEWRQELKLN